MLVTGAAGFLGYHLSQALHQRGYDLTLCDDFSRGCNDPEFQALRQCEGIRFLNLDLVRTESFQNLGGPYDFVFHLAAVNGTRFFYEKPDEVLKINLLSTIYLLDWFVSSGSKKFLFASSSEAYAGTISLFQGLLPTPETIPLCIPDIYNPRFSYAASKIAGEGLVIHYSRRHRFRMHIARYHNIYGPRMGMEHVIPQLIQRAMAKENPFKIHGEKHKRAFCYVSDAVEATLRLMESDRLDGEVVHIGNPAEEIEILELAKKICSLADWDPCYEALPAPPGSVERRIPSIKKIGEVLGFRPKIHLTTGLNKTYEWFNGLRHTS